MAEKIEFVGLGYCSNDHLCRVEAIPLDHKVEALEYLTQGGGPAATAGVCAARLGMKTAFTGVAGDDDSGKRIVSDLEREGISTEHFVVRKGATTSTAFCWIDASGKRSIVWRRGNGADLTGDEIPYETIANARILHLDGHQTSAALAAAKFAKAKGVLVSIDAGTLRPGVGELVKYCDIFIASEFFARTFTGISDYEASLRELVNVGARVTGITMGAEGSMCFDRETGRIVRCPGFRVPVVDTTGAGDVFHAAFAVNYARSGELAGSMRFASAVAALKCTRLGGRTGIPTLAETERFLSEHPLPDASADQ